MKKIVFFVALSYIFNQSVFSSNQNQFTFCDESCLTSSLQGSILKTPEGSIIDPSLLANFFSKHIEINSVDFSNVSCSPTNEYDGFDACAFVLSKVPELKSISLKNIDIHQEGMQALTQINSLEQLKLDHTLDFDFDHIISKRLAEMALLKELTLNRTNIDDFGIYYLASSSSLKKLTILSSTDGYRITSAGVAALANNQSIIDLSIIDQEIGYRGATVLASNPHLIHLNLNGNKLQDLGVSAFAKNNTLKSLSVERNEITSDGLINLSENSTLTTLNLEGNSGIGDEGIMALANMKSLTHLNLSISSNSNKDLSIAYLVNHLNLQWLAINSIKIGKKSAEAIGHNKTLVHLFAHNCELDNDTLALLLKNQAFKELDLSRNNFSAKTVAKMASLPNLEKLSLSENQSWSNDDVAIQIAKNPHIKILYFASAGLRNDGAYALAKNTTLKELYIRNNAIEDNGANAFIENETLNVLDISTNKISKEGREKLSNHKSIEKIII